MLATCFGVFLLPFLLPPPVIQGVSVANAAGFNNKVAAVAAASMGLVVFLFKLRDSRPVLWKQSGDYGSLGIRMVAGVVAVTMAAYGALCWLVVISHARYFGDAGYFIEQIGAHADYGRRLYDEIEFPYGPLLFYMPIAMHALLSPLHVSLTGAYYLTLLVAQGAGLLLMAYTLNRLPILYRWKMLLLMLCVPLALELNFGLNYTLFRFGVSIALLVWVSTFRRVEAAAASLLVGECVSLSVSPEMGFAYLAGGAVYAGCMMWTQGRRWLLGLFALPVAVILFLLIAGRGYVGMLGLFARGIYNFIVEPLPHILIFLFALVWLVPAGLAAFFRERRPETPKLAAVCVFGMALLPVAFGRADPGHVTYNGLAILFLSMVGAAFYRRRLQAAWAVAVSALVMWTAFIDTRPFQLDIRGVIHYDVLHYGSPPLQAAALKITQKLSPAAAQHYLSVKFSEDDAFDVTPLQRLIGRDRVATPEAIPLPVEQALKAAGRYTPQFYCFGIAVLDRAAEERQIADLNMAKWALIPQDADPDHLETQADTGAYLGFTLPYRMQHQPYKVGPRFRKNLQDAWRPYAVLGEYEIYQRR